MLRKCIEDAVRSSYETAHSKQFCPLLMQATNIDTAPCTTSSNKTATLFLTRGCTFLPVNISRCIQFLTHLGQQNSAIRPSSHFYISSHNKETKKSSKTTSDARKCQRATYYRACHQIQCIMSTSTNQTKHKNM